MLQTADLVWLRVGDARVFAACRSASSVRVKEMAVVSRRGMTTLCLRVMVAQPLAEPFAGTFRLRHG